MLGICGSAWAESRIPYIVSAGTATARLCAFRDGRPAQDCRDCPKDGEGFRCADGSTGKLLSPPGRALRLAAFGDSGTGSRDQRAVAAALAARDPDFVLLLGDLVYPAGELEDYSEKYFAPYRDLLGRIPFFPAPGNHDYGDIGRPAARAAARFREGYARVHERPAYYSFDAGDAHFVALDDNREGHRIEAAESVAAGSAQRAWLERDLEASRARWKIVFMHVPLYSSGPHGSKKPLQEALSGVFSRLGVDLVLAGHDHLYERSRGLDGVVHVTAGTGGAGLYKKKSENAWSAALHRRHGFVELAVARDSLTLEFRGVDGKILDRLELKKP